MANDPKTLEQNPEEANEMAVLEELLSEGDDNVGDDVNDSDEDENGNVITSDFE